MQQVESRQLAVSLYILDACRVSPFPGTSAWERGPATDHSRVHDKSAVEAFDGPDEEALDYLADPKSERNSH
jgi:hypothetical protein